MIRILLFFLLIISVCSCADLNVDNDNFERLRMENDSLKRIVTELKTKYIFDSISVRDIPSYKNQYELNAEVSGEIVFVGYNLNKKSFVIKFDDMDYENESKYINPDTLENIRGGYKYKKILTSDFNIFRAELKTENEFGKSFNIIYNTAIKTDKTNGN